MSLLFNDSGVPTIESIRDQLAIGPRSLAFATAYVTYSGTNILFERTPIKQADATKKQFLVGIDWFRSEPNALESLNMLPNSEVRVHDADYLLENRCHPRTTFHPKSYLFRGAVKHLLVGSANLSANGLSRSIEISLTTSLTAEVEAYETWFTSKWNQAKKWSEIRDSYGRLYVPNKVREVVVTEDDELQDFRVLRLRWVTADRLRILRAAQNLWVDVGGLHNRDIQGLPGTDLQFTQMTRVFFGRVAKIVPGNTSLGDVRLTMCGAHEMSRPMVFNKSSSMDRLSLPVPEENGWPASYDYKALLFTKWPDGSYRVRVAKGNDRAAWKQKSNSYGFVVEMQRGEREWGTF